MIIIFKLFKKTSNSKNTKTLSRTLQISFYRFSLSSLATLNDNSSNIEINIPREVSYFTLQNIYISLQFNLTINVAANTQHPKIIALFAANFGPIALFSEKTIYHNFG